MATVPYQHLGSALATDYLFVREQFNDEAMGALPAPRGGSSHDEVLPAINELLGARRAAVAADAAARRPRGSYGEDIAGYGCRASSRSPAGLVNMELHRGDGTLGTFLGVQSGLAMKSIDPARLGGNGVLLENHVIRHLGDIEVIHTYEGTETMQSLIVGRDITGVGAFAS